MTDVSAPVPTFDLTTGTFNLMVLMDVNALTVSHFPMTRCLPED